MISLICRLGLLKREEFLEGDLRVVRWFVPVWPFVVLMVLMVVAIVWRLA